MMFLLRMLTRRKGGASMDPLHVSMTGVRMGERFLQIGCSDKALLAGLASKVGLSGTAAVAAYTADEAKRAESVGRKVGALIEIKNAAEEWPFEDDAFDMVVVDDTDAAFWTHSDPDQVLKHALRSVRQGGRIEVVTRASAHEEVTRLPERLSNAGFKPVRVLAERDGFRFIEGLKTLGP